MLGPGTTDAALLQASLEGDRQAFAGIVERYKSLVCAIAYSSTGDLGLSEDLAQEAFVSAWTHLGSLRDPRKLRPWLCTIARRLAKRSAKKRRRDVITHAAPLDASQDTAAEDLSPRDLAINKEEETVLWRSLERIPETYRVPLILYYRQGESVQRVAETLGLATAAVKQRLARGRNLLRDEVAGFVEQSLARTRPRKTFALGVLAALPKASSVVSVTASPGAAAMTLGGLLAMKKAGNYPCGGRCRRGRNVGADTDPPTARDARACKDDERGRA